MSGLLTPLPLEFIRQYASTIDEDSAFTTTSDRLAYLTSPRRAAGQVSADLQEEALYYLNTARTAWIPIAVTGGAFTNYTKDYAFSVTFDGGAGTGATGSVTIPTFLVKEGWFIETVFVNVTDTLVEDSTGGYITLGYTGTDAIGLNSTTGLISTLNSEANTKIELATLTESTSDSNQLVVAVNGDNLTAGTITVLVRVTNYIEAISGDSVSGGSGGNTIYTADDSLTGDRTVDLNGHFLEIKDADEYNFIFISPKDYEGDLFVGDGISATGLNINANSASNTYFNLVTSNALNSVTINGDSNANTLTYTAGSHIFNSDLIVNGLTVGKGASNILSNTAVGIGVLGNNSTGSNNTGIGQNALILNSTGTRNTAVGEGTLSLNVSGDYNTAIGYQSLVFNSVGSSNTAIGTQALNLNLGSNNTAVGYGALRNNNTAAFNTAMGYTALAANTDGSNNTAVGFGSLSSNTTGSENTAMGGSASMDLNTTGSRNSAYGSDSLRQNITGDENTAIGYGTLDGNTIGAGNVALGYHAGFYNEGDNTTSVGHNANSVFNDDVASQKTFDATDIDVANDGTIHITAHGFGADGTRRLVRYTEGTSPVTGMSNGNIYNALIVDVDTINIDVVQVGGTSTGNILTPQFKYTNTIAIGEGIQNTASNQVMLGNSSITRVVLAGGLQQFANNAAALSGGLDINDIYYTNVAGDGVLKIVI